MPTCLVRKDNHSLKFMRKLKEIIRDSLFFGVYIRASIQLDAYRWRKDVTP